MRPYHIRLRSSWRCLRCKRSSSASKAGTRAAMTNSCTLTRVCARMWPSLSFSGSGRRRLNGLVTSARTSGASQGLGSPLPLPVARAGRDRTAVDCGSNEVSAAVIKLSGLSRGRRVRKLATEHLLVKRLNFRHRLEVLLGELAYGAAFARSLAERDPVADYGCCRPEMVVVGKCRARVLGLFHGRIGRSAIEHGERT